MKKYCLLTGILICFAIQAFSQHKTYFGGGVSVTNDKYELHDPDGMLKISPLINGTFQATIGQELSSFFTLETGFIKKQYSEGFHFKDDFSNGSTGSLTSVQFPLRLKARLPVYRDKIFFTTSAGYVFAINKSYYPGLPGGSPYALRGEGTETNGQNSYKVAFGSRYNFGKTYSLVQAGLGIDFLIRKKIILGLSTSYFAGFNQIMQTDITYQQTTGDVPHAAKISGKGNYWNYGISASYPISEIWQKKN